MRAAKLIFKGFLVIPAFFCLSCQRANLTSGARGREISQVKRIVVFPFPGDKKNSDSFYALAAKELWPGGVVAQEDVLTALRESGLGARGIALSKDQAVLIGIGLGADAVAAGYVDREQVLRIKIVEVATRDEWTRTRSIAAGDGLRVFVGEVKSDFRNSRDTAFKRAARKNSPAPVKKSVAWPSKNAAEKSPQNGAVAAPALPADGGGRLPSSRTELPPARSEPLGETSIYDFDYKNIGRKTAD